MMSMHTLYFQLNSSTRFQYHNEGNLLKRTISFSPTMIMIVYLEVTAARFLATTQAREPEVPSGEADC